MNFTKNQIIVLAVGVSIFLILILILTGVLPGLKPGTGGRQSGAKLVMWGVFDDINDYFPAISSFTSAYSGIEISYRQMDPETYEEDLINALAAGQGPDIFMFHNAWLPKHYDKIFPLPEQYLNLETFRQLFPTVVEQDFTAGGAIYAMPLSIDTLALFYNKDILDQSGVALPPTNWSEFQGAVLKTRKIDPPTNQIIRAGAAIGGSDESVNRATDILNLLMLQTGTQMVNANFTDATFANREGLKAPGSEALQYYTQFANPANPYYTWNEDFLYSLDAFSQGKVAMVFNYAYQIPLLQNKNPFLDFGIAATPQPDNAEQNVSFANYWGYAVSNRSSAPEAAWQFVLYLTTNEGVARAYIDTSDKPPALRTLINQYQRDPVLGVFVRQALTARSWPQIDNNKIEVIFSEMIQSVINGRSSAEEAVNDAQGKVNQLMRRRQI